MPDKNKVKIIEDLEYEININEKNKKKDDKEGKKESGNIENTGS